VVTDDQKKQIYSIQDEYKPKLNALKEQLKALTAERDAKLDALLTADQKTKVEAKRAEAQAKRAEAKAIAKRAEAKAQRAEKKESRGKSAKHVATPSTETPVEKPADQAPPK
jgi:peptidoglycan hydrolase CwlO-like protein